MPHHFALHCGEQDLCYLNHILTTWDQITLGEEAIRQALDVPTVKRLQLRAPSASTLDRDYVIRQMDLPSNRSELFPGVEDRVKRNLIKQALLRLEVVISTIKTFHENRRYLGIGMKIIKKLLLDEEKPKRSIYKAMYAHWRAPATLSEEIRSGDFRDVALERPDMAARFYFMQVFVAALREFPNLSDDGPLKDPDSKKRKRDSNSSMEVISGLVNLAYKIQFLRCAHSRGFRTKKVASGLRDAEDLAVEVPEPFMEDDNGEIIKWRNDTPSTNVYK